jgi:hypothetical protein
MIIFSSTRIATLVSSNNALLRKEGLRLVLESLDELMDL